MLHALRRSNLQHCIDLEETGSICCHYLRVFVTVSLFLIICGPVEEPHWRDDVPSCRGKRPKTVTPDFGAYCCFEEVLRWIGSTNFFSLTIESNVTGADQDHRKDLPYCPRISCWYTTWDNHIMEALAKQDNEINEDYDFWNAAPKLKTPYLKFCNAHNNRLHNVLAEYRIICEDETQTTTASVKGMILNWKSRTPMSRQ